MPILQDPAAVSQEATNNILTAIIGAWILFSRNFCLIYLFGQPQTYSPFLDNMKAGKAAQVQRSATEALLNALLFVRTNMAAEVQCLNQN